MNDDNISQSIKDRLVSGEKIVGMAQIHWGIFWQVGALIVVSLLLFIFVAKNLGFLMLGVAIMFALYRMAIKSILLLVITNKRILFRYGLLQIDVVDLHFDKVESIELERMLPGYLLGYANVVVMGTGQRHVVIPYVANGPALRKAYSEMVLGSE